MSFKQIYQLIVSVLLISVMGTMGYVANNQCGQKRPPCDCAIGKPHFWIDHNTCKFACNLDGTLITCQQNEQFQHRSLCKNKPAPCECKIGKPTWTGDPPNCQFICELEDLKMSCEETNKYVGESCNYVVKPCVCKIGIPFWSGEPPNSCEFFCSDDDKLLTCKEIDNL